MAQGQSYRLILLHVSVTGPVQLELIVIVGSSDESRGPALVTHVMSVPTPSTVEFTFEPTHDEDRAAVSLFVDAVGPSGVSKLCLGGARLDPRRTETDTGTEPASAVAAAAGKKKQAAPKGGTEKPGDKPTKPPQVNCEPPWYIDAQGIQRFKQTCL